MGDYDDKFAEIEYLQQRITDVIEDAALCDLRNIYSFIMSYMGEDA